MCRYTQGLLLSVPVGILGFLFLSLFRKSCLRTDRGCSPRSGLQSDTLPLSPTLLFSLLGSIPVAAGSRRLARGRVSGRVTTPTSTTVVFGLCLQPERMFTSKPRSLLVCRIITTKYYRPLRGKHTSLGPSPTPGTGRDLLLHVRVFTVVSTEAPTHKPSVVRSFLPCRRWCRESSEVPGRE